MNFSSVQTRLFRPPYFVIFYHQCVLDLRASDKRAPDPHIIGYLKPAYPPHYGLTSKRLPLLAGEVHCSGARGVPFTAFLPHPGCMPLADIIWLYMLSTTNDYAVTLYTRSHAFNARVLSRILFWTLDFTILVSTGRKLALSSSASPAVLFAGDCANLPPFEQSVVRL